MTRLNLETSGRAENMIRAYAAGEVVINEETFRTSVIITPEAVYSGWAPERFEDIEASHFEEVMALEPPPEIIVLGTGGTQRFLHPAVTTELQRRGIGFEAMDTAAACRTYNVLRGEDRRVAAALLMIEQ